MVNKRLFVLVLVILIFSGCGVNKEVEVKSIAPKSATPTIVSPEITKDSSKATVRDSDTLDQFIKKIHPKDEHLQKIIKEDLDLDGKPEYVLAFGLEKENFDSIFVIREDAGFHIIDKLEDPVIVVHLNTDVKIMKLDQTDQKFIVVYSVGDGGAYAEGFSIYALENNHIKSINSDFPNATGQGIRKLKDTNHDGVFESVDYYEFSDTQEHTIVAYQKYDGTGPEKLELLYKNKSKNFVYPTDPKAVIQNYLEVDYLMKRFDIPFLEMDQLTDPAARQTYDFEEAIDFSSLAYLSYSGLDLSYEEISGDENRKVFLVKDNSLEERAKKEITFTLEKQSGKWKIIDIGINDKL
ncbi:hypothetical protein C1I60_04685 [Paenibacillus terrae]|uniref:Lipoprotein n=1 Tax=Paenibacillus terrae TaxID=159743 RepID=A0A4U2Q4L4_9BACL|nr:hypothetical protein [Paenibacillus terrae]TKH45756.1 hypothetical protein C1I60_04685 [Paenibacillus terrae]